MPVIWGGNRDCIDILIVQNAGKIGLGGRFLLGNFAQLSQCLWKQSFVDIAEGRNPDTRNFAEALIMRLAPAPQSHHREVNRVVGTMRPPQSTNKGRRDSSPRGGLNKLAAINCFHFDSLPLAKN